MVEAPVQEQQVKKGFQRILKEHTFQKLEPKPWGPLV